LPGAAIHRLVFSLVVAGLAAGCNPRPMDERGYESGIAAARTEKDRFLSQNRDSPVPANRKSALLPLRYYPIESAFNIPAVLKPSADQQVIAMPTSAGTADQMQRVGTLEFTVKGQALRLAAFAPAATRVDHLFVPFRDATTGKTTYEAGRYLDLDRTASGIYQLDFNRAYNPNCYFSVTWACPLPPRENTLPIEITAGEQAVLE
jgi:uncharacterized protein (DUF1684 family)